MSFALKFHKSRLRTIALFVFVIAFFVLGTTYTGFRIWFKTEINQISENAMIQFEGDKVAALIAYLESNSPTLNEKNKAIWALGKLNDKRALPVLHSLIKGMECDHTAFVCQRELDKAIRNLEGKSIDLLTFKSVTLNNHE